MAAAAYGGLLALAALALAACRTARRVDGLPMKLPALATLAAILSAPAAAAAAGQACDRARAVDVLKAAAAREGVDVSTLELAVEGPYAPAKFVRTHPTFPLGSAVRRKLGKRPLFFVWFHPPFSRSFGAKGADVWALVGEVRCEILHLVRER